MGKKKLLMLAFFAFLTLSFLAENDTIYFKVQNIFLIRFTYFKSKGYWR